MARLHALLCAYAALLAVLGPVLAPPAQWAQDEAAPSVWLGAAMFSAMGWCAHQLLRREQPWRRLRRWLALCLPLGIAGALAAAWLGEPSAEARWVCLLGAAVAALLAVCAWRTLAQVQFWLLAEVPRQPPAERLAPPRNWRTLLTLTLFAFVWMAPVEWLVPHLLGP